MARLILDTGVLIAGARGHIDLSMLSDTDDIALPAIALAEYHAGVLADADPGRAAVQEAFLKDVLTVVPIIDYDRAVAEHHAALLAHTRSQGRPRGPHDLIIAATARAAARTLITTDTRAHFGELPGLTTRELTL